jgi:hypothetical protein
MRLPAERLLEVERRLAHCQPHPAIARELSQQWGVSERQIRTYVSAVYARWAREAEERRDHRRAEIRATLQRIVHEAMSRGEYRAATMAADRLAKLEGLYVERLEFTGDVTTRGGGASIVALSEEQVIARIREIEEQHPEIRALIDGKEKR